MIDNSYQPVAAEQIVTKARPKAPVFVRDIKREDVPPLAPAELVPFRHYSEIVDGETVTYWRCPVTYTESVHFTIIEFNTLECQCVTWT